MKKIILQSCVGTKDHKQETCKTTVANFILKCSRSLLIEYVRHGQSSETLFPVTTVERRLSELIGTIYSSDIRLFG